MKTLKHISSLVLKPAVGLFAIALTVTACSDKKDLPIPAAPAAVAVVHASPGAPELTFKINGTKANLKALTFGTFLSYGNINAGSYEFSVTKKDSARVLTKSTVEMKSNKVYSVFIADVPAKPAFVLVEDILTAPAADKANLRFVNMSPDGGSLDLGITGQATPLFTKTAFKGATAFASVTPGAELNFEVKENTKTDVIAKLEKVKIEKGKIYTIWAKGLKAVSDTTKLSLKVITNK